MANTQLDIEADKLYGYKPVRPFSPVHGQIYMAPNVPPNPRDGEIYFNEDTENTYRYDAKLKVWSVLTPNTELDRIRRMAGLPLAGEKVTVIDVGKKPAKVVKKILKDVKKGMTMTGSIDLSKKETPKEPLLKKLKAKMPKMEFHMPARLGMFIQEIM